MNPLLLQFLSEAQEFSQDIGNKLMQLEETPDDQNVINELFRLVHTLKGNSGLFTFPEMTRVLHAGEDLLGMVRTGEIAYSRELADRLLEGIDLTMAMRGDIELTGKIDASRAQDSMHMVEALRSLLPAAPGAARDRQAVELAKSGRQSAANAEAESTMPQLAEISEVARMDAFRRATSGETIAWILYTPLRECFFQGDDPLHLARQVPGLLWGKPYPSEPLPSLTELDTYSCVLDFHLLSATMDGELAEHFRYVPDQVHVVEVDPLSLVIPNGSTKKSTVHPVFSARALEYLEKGDLDGLNAFTIKSLQEAIACSWQSSALRWLLVLLECIPKQRAALQLLIESMENAGTPQWESLGRVEDSRATGSAAQSEGGEERLAEQMRVRRDLLAGQSKDGAVALNAILKTQRQILQLVDHPIWEAGRMRAVGSVLKNLSIAAGNGQDSGEIDSEVSASLATNDSAPLLKWLDKNMERLANGVPQAAAGSIETCDGLKREVDAVQTVQGMGDLLTGDAVIKSGQRPGDPTSGQRSLKVDQAKIDRLMNLIGELVVEKNALPYLAQRAEAQYGVRELSREIKAQYLVINRIADEMQDAILQVRMTSVSTVFQRFPRLVRDISRKLGKEVHLVLEGDQTEADKNIIESLADPLIHILRNSLDHGLETPEVRRASGKPETGTLTIRAAQHGDRVGIEVIDDGKGIDPAVIKQKAYEKGLIDEAALERIDDQEALNLIFAAGLSTAAVISDLSGRGVGMDVVRSEVEKMNGSVVVSSELGKGTTIRISLPLSMAVTQVMIVESDHQLFGIPLDHVIETVRVAKTAIRFIKQSMTAILRDRVIPLKAINELLQISARARTNADDEFAVLLVSVGSEVLGLIVDGFRETIGVIQKPLGGVLSGLSAYSGSALLGDGSVLMILNIREVL